MEWCGLQVAVPPCGAGRRLSACPGWGSGGPGRGGRRGPRCPSAVSSGRSPAAHVSTPASAFSRPRGSPWWPSLLNTEIEIELNEYVYTIKQSPEYKHLSFRVTFLSLSQYQLIGDQFILDQSTEAFAF